MVLAMADISSAALEFNDYDFGKNPNNYNLMNFTANSLLFFDNVNLAVINSLPSRSNILDRTLKIAGSGIGGVILSVLGHEAAHGLAALRNGGKNIRINWSPETFWTGSCRSVGNFSNLERQKISSAGLNWQNSIADKVVGENTGKEVDVSQLLLFGLNQLNFTLYYFRSTSKPFESSSSADPINWARYVAGDDMTVARLVYDDLRKGAVWQAAGAVIPLWVGINYWLFGKEYRMPNWWVNPQAELTDAGVMFTLSIWHRFESSGAVVKIKPGYGQNRVQEKNKALPMYSLETQAQIPIKGFVVEMSGNYSHTLRTAMSFGVGISYKF